MQPRTQLFLPVNNNVKQWSVITAKFAYKNIIIIIILFPYTFLDTFLNAFSKR